MPKRQSGHVAHDNKFSLRISDRAFALSFRLPLKRDQHNTAAKISGMAEGPNWHKHVAIGTYVLIVLTIILIALAILTFVRPPDPEHPMSMDFLSKSITLSPWILAACIVAIVASTRWLVRTRTLAMVSREPKYGRTVIAASPGPPADQIEKRDELVDALQRKTNEQLGELSVAQERYLLLQEERDQLQSQVARLESQNEALNTAFHLQLRSANREPIKQSVIFYGGGPSPEKPSPLLPQFESDQRPVNFNWPAVGLGLEVSFIKNGSYGFLISVVNRSSDWIGPHSAKIIDANSWSDDHRKFLPSRGFPPREVVEGKELGPMRTTGRDWLIKTTMKGPTLSLGNDDQRTLIWPNHDRRTDELWRLTLELSYHPNPQVHVPSNALPPVFLLVLWKRDTDTLLMTEGAE